MQHAGEIEGRGRLLPRIATITLAAIVGTVALGVVLQLQGASYKAWVIVLGVSLLPTALAIIGHPKEILLFGWVFALTYNREYFVFEKLVGYNGTQGPYVILADLCLIGLYGWWLYEHLMHRRREEPVHGSPLWLWYIPFAAVSFLSVFAATRPDWALYEMIRIVKIGFILFYVRRNFGRREWQVTLAALASAVFFQSAVAIKEVITGKAGVIGAAQEPADMPGFVEHFADGGFTGSIVRGVGTLAHPPYLACYLLLVLPVLLALALSAPRRRAFAYAVTFLLGCGGLAATLSRGPWILAVIQVALVVGVMVLLRQLAAKHALGLAVIGSFVLLMGLLPVRDKLMNRLTGDFTESMRYREEGTRAALRAIEDRPLLGFGLNNTEIFLGYYLPEMEWGLVTEEFASRTLHLRAPIALGNGFLHVAEETGILGLIAFLFFVTGGAVVGLRSVARTAGEERAVCVGLLIGILGALAEQVVDTPLWVDPVLYTFTLYIGLLNIAASLFKRSQQLPQIAAVSAA